MFIRYKPNFIVERKSDKCKGWGIMIAITRQKDAKNAKEKSLSIDFSTT